MKRDCEVCGNGFDCRSSRARFCSPKCRNRSGYLRRSGAVDAAVSKLASVESLVDAVLERVRGAESTPEAQAALVLARRADSGQEPLAAVVAATKELTRLLSSIEAPAAPGAKASDTPTNPLDDLAQRRQQRAAV